MSVQATDHIPPSIVYAVVTTAESRIAVERSMPRMTPKVEPIATSSSALQNTSPAIAGRKRTAAHRFPNRASNGSMSVVNPKRRIVAAKKTPQEQTDAEAQSALRAELNRGFVRAFSGAEQI